MDLDIRVDNTLADQIVVAWLKQHIRWAQDSYDNAVHEEDKADAAADMLAMRRILKYVGGEG